MVSQTVLTDAYLLFHFHKGDCLYMEAIGYPEHLSMGGGESN